ncbi:MAG: Druantia anti-phage system protein DruA, partial [Opitutaceae bacterium]
METAQRIQGRWVRPEDIVWLRDWMATHPDWSRKRLARELCAAWSWRDSAGRVKDFAARSFL